VAIDSAALQIDLTKPVVSVTGVGNGASYTLGSVPTAGCDTQDALSGVDAQATLSVTGGNSNGAGSFTATCSGAADKAGNTGSASASYSVVYNFTGFFRPVENLPTLNVAKAGSGIPVKFSLSGNQGLGIMAAGSPSSRKIACDSSSPLDAVEETVTAGGSSLSYDALADQYVYVWKTDKAWGGTCRELTVTLNDGSNRRVNFKFNK
jgi:hypothetical protein